MKKAIVTGATGFIGSWIVKELLDHNVEVTVVVRENRRNSIVLDDRVRIVYCDMENYNTLPELICDRGFDVFYHLAWAGVSGIGLQNDELQIQNIRSTLQVIRVLPILGCKRIVGAGSLHEIESIFDMNIDKTISNLGYMYKSSKIAAHWMGKALSGSLGIEFFWPIVTNTYGIGENSKRLVNSIIRSILRGDSPELSEGNQLYDFIYISDVAKAFFLIGENGINGNNYVIGSGNAKPLKEYLQVVGDITNTLCNSSIDLGFGKNKGDVVFLPPNVFDISNLVRDTGFSPSISFQEGIERTVRWIMHTENKEHI